MNIWAGRQNRLRLSFPAHEVKNDQALDFLLPAEASERIKRYIKEWRSLFIPATNPYLFPGRNGKPKDQSALRNQMKKAIFDHTGLQMTPHQFRHAAAKLAAGCKPGHYEVVRKLLGHKSLTTTYAHYAGAETDAAVELYDDIILQLRRPAAIRSATEASNHRTRSQKGKPRRLTATPKEPPFMDPSDPAGSEAGEIKWGKSYELLSGYRLARVGSKPLAICDNKGRVPFSRRQSSAMGSRNKASSGEGLWQMGLLFDVYRSPALRRTVQARLIAVTKDRLRAYVDLLTNQGLASQTIASRLTDLCEALRVMCPSCDLTMIKHLYQGAEQRANRRAIKLPGSNTRLRFGLPP